MKLAREIRCREEQNTGIVPELKVPIESPVQRIVAQMRGFGSLYATIRGGKHDEAKEGNERFGRA